MTQGSSNRPTRRVGRRDWRAIALIEIVTVTAASVGFFTVLWSFRNGFTAAPTKSVVALMIDLGEGAREPLMGALGVVATVQLACLIAIVTGQIVHPDGAEESKLRGMLSVISLGAVTAVAPAVLAVSLYSARSLDDSGFLLVALPIYLLQLAISTAIGTFEVGDDETLRDLAQERVARAHEQISRLEGRRSLSPWRAVLGVVIVLIISAVATIGYAAALPDSHSISTVGNVVPALIAFGGGLSWWTYGLILANSQLKLSARASDVAWVVALLVFNVLVYLFFLLLVARTYPPLTVAATIALCVLIVLTFTSVVEANRVRRRVKPRRWPSPVLGVVGLVGTRHALASARKEKESAEKRADKYSRSIAEYEAEHGADEAGPGPTSSPETLPCHHPESPRLPSRLRRAFDELIR